MAPERAFLMLAIPFGVALLLLLPPGAAPDEGYHLGRVWTLSEGHLRLPAPGEPPLTIPRSIVELSRAVNGEALPARPPRRSFAELRALAGAPLAPAQRVYLNLGAAYPPAVYVPSLVGVGLARAFRLPVGSLFGWARAANLAVWVALTWLAIRLAPLRRWTIVLLAATPMSLSVAASVSADPLTNAAALLFLVVVLRAALGRSGPLARAEVIALLGAALLLGAVKGGYWALALASLLIPVARCGGRARYLALSAAAASATLVPSGLWLAEVRCSGALAGGSGGDAAAQLGGLLADPLGFAAVLATTLAAFAGPFVLMFVGTLGQLTVWLPEWAYAGYAAALACVAVGDGPQPAALTGGRRLLLVAIFVVCVVAIVALIYVGSNQPGAAQVHGVQGRYFIPAAPALFLALPSLARPLPRKVQLALVAVAACVDAIAVAAVLARYYTFP